MKNPIEIRCDVQGLTLRAKMLVAYALAVGLSGCGGSSRSGPTDEGSQPPPVAVFTIGGTVQGLKGTGLVLKDGQSLLSVFGNGAFAFPRSVPAGTVFAVTVETEPSSPGQHCTVTSGAGTVSGDVTNVGVSCTSPDAEPGVFTLGGTVKGLQGTGLVLQNKGPLLPIVSNGAFTFHELVSSGALFDITVATQPSNPIQHCAIVNGTGAATANVTGVEVSCTADSGAPSQRFTIGGTVQGLQGTGLVLSDNGVALAVAGDGGFAFQGQLSSGSNFNVIVTTQPASPAQHCVVENGIGIVLSDVTDIRVLCAVQLVLTESTPAAGATEVHRDVRPVLHFSGVLNPATVTTANVRLESPAGPEELTMVTTGNSAAIVASRKLMPAVPYQLSVANLRGANGESHDPLHVDFLTRDGAWQAPLEIEDFNGTLDGPQIAVGANGAAFVVWTHFADGVRRVWVSRYDAAAQVWGPRRALNPTHPFAATDPQVVVSATGDAFVVWRTHVQPAGTAPLSVIWAARYDAGTGAWKDEKLSHFHADQPRIALDDAGNALAVWRQEEGVALDPRNMIVARRYEVGSGWEPPVPLHKVTIIDSAASGHSATPRIVMSADGRAVVAWVQQVSRGAIEKHVWANTFNCTGWGQPERIDYGYASSTNQPPRVVIDGKGDALAVWVQTDSDAFMRVVANRFVSGTGWGATAVPISPAVTHGLEPQLAVDRGGNAIAVWRAVSPSFSDALFANHFDAADNAWDAEVRVLADDEIDESPPDLSVDASGNALVIFRIGVIETEIPFLITAARRYVAHNGSWDAITPLSPRGDFLVTPPKLGLDRQGNAWALWEHSDFDLGPRLFTTRFE